MRATTMRAAMELADQVAANIRDGHRLPPDRAELVAAMIPAARRITRAARWLNAAIEWQHQAVALAVQAAADARADVDRVASEWLAQATDLAPDDAAFEAIASKLADVDADQAGDAG